MKTKILVTLLCLSLTSNLLAQEIVAAATSDFSYRNLREANSNLISSNKEEDIKKLYKNTPAIKTLRNIINDKNINRCATKVVSTIKSQLNLNSKQDVELAVLGLRLDESIDDITAGIIIKASDLGFMSHPIAKDDLTAEEEEKAIAVYKSYSKEFQNKSLCIEDTYRELVAKLGTSSFKFIKHLKHINKLALDHRVLTNEGHKSVERMRANKVHEWPLTLDDYKTNLDAIAKAFPNRTKESSKLVTNTARFKSKTSLRQGLYEKFDSTQIILLANVVKSLKKRLDSKDIVVHINYVDQVSEMINLSAMEKFRFILKLLRKELATINNSNMLSGPRANYIDIITAAYEVGYISSDEIEQLAGLEDIWNPKKTTKEKVMVWVHLFGGVASVLLPPPFGFLSVMTIMLIDQQMAEAPVDPDSDFNLI